MGSNLYAIVFTTNERIFVRDFEERIAELVRDELSLRGHVAIVETAISSPGIVLVTIRHPSGYCDLDEIQSGRPSIFRLGYELFERCRVPLWTFYSGPLYTRFWIEQTPDMYAKLPALPQSFAA